MIKSLLKLFMPKPATLAGWAADGIRKSVNECTLTDSISKYATLANEAAQTAEWLTSLVTDGKISETERDEIATKLEPLFEKLKGLL